MRAALADNISSAVSIRKVTTVTERIHREGHRSLTPEPWQTTVVAAVVKNPWAGRGYVEDLLPEIRETAPAIANVIVPRLVAEFGDPGRIAAYGKAALAGIGCELEHAAALIQTLRFGNVLRELAAGTSYMSATNRRGATGSLLMVPLVHKQDASRASHVMTCQIAIPDAPHPDEIVVAVAASSMGRPFAKD